MLSEFVISAQVAPESVERSTSESEPLRQRVAPVPVVMLPPFAWNLSVMAFAVQCAYRVVFAVGE